jgi:hypothetical protein
MSVPDFLHLRRKADRVLFAAWLNLGLTAIVCFFAPDRVMATVVGCVWASLVSIVAVIAARRIDRKESRVER